MAPGVAYPSGTVEASRQKPPCHGPRRPQFSARNSSIYFSNSPPSHQRALIPIRDTLTLGRAHDARSGASSAAPLGVARGRHKGRCAPLYGRLRRAPFTNQPVIKRHFILPLPFTFVGIL